MNAVALFTRAWIEITERAYFAPDSITADDVTHLSFLSYGGTLVLAIEGIIAAITIWLVTGVIFNRKGK